VTGANYSDVMHQLTAAGLILPRGESLRIGTAKPVRCHVQDGGREKRGWYLLKEWCPSTDRVLIVGAYGIWRGNDNGAQKIVLPKDDHARVTPEQHAAMKKMWAEAAKNAERQRRHDAAIASARATKAWAKLLPEGESPYLNAKGIIGYGLKYTEHHTAVVPMVDTGGKIHGLQFLRNPAQAKTGKRPEKEFWPPGLAKQGHFHLLGHTPHWIVLVAEGYATAASLHAATGYPVACAFDAGNIQTVAEALRRRYKTAKILICADDDGFGKCQHSACRTRIALAQHPHACPACGQPHGITNTGVTAASTAAMAVGGEWVAVRFADDPARTTRWLDDGRKLTDYNDLHAVEGLAAVGAQIAARLSELHWAPPELRGVPSSTSGGAGSQRLRPLQHLDDILARYALIYAGGGAVFDREEHCLLPLADMKNACIRPELHKAWMEHADRVIVRQREVGFDPAGTDPDITCNLWGGWPTAPKAGNCERLLALLQYLCSGEKDEQDRRRNNTHELYLWVLRWLAYPLQHPGAKMKTALVIHGRQGTGKNLFFEAYMKIFGQYGGILDQNALLDKHNDWASRKLFLIADEVVAQAHRFEHKNLLKVLITGHKVRINPKHLAAYDETNHVNLVFLSNETMPVVLEEDDRRHCVIWTPKKQDRETYRAVADEMNNGGIAALHHYLLHLDLGDFNPDTPPPETKAKKDLVQLGLDTPAEFIDAVKAGDIPPLKLLPGKTQDWYRMYQRWCTHTGNKFASMKRFVVSLDKQRNFPTVRKGYKDGVRTTNPCSFLLFGKSCPEGEVESDWLGEYYKISCDLFKDYLAGNTKAFAEDAPWP